jgi:PTS system nitrogen regulatory IIA component
MLGVSADTVRRWARQGRLGTLRPSGEYRFEADELREWATARGMKLASESKPKLSRVCPETQPLCAALERGGMPIDVSATSVKGVLSQLADSVPELSAETKAELLADLVAREELSSTGMDAGVAIPHPRTPNSKFTTKPKVLIAQLQEPVDWHALDGNPVHTVFLLLNPSPKEHLTILSRLAFLLREDEFCALLGQDPCAETILAKTLELEPRS